MGIDVGNKSSCIDFAAINMTSNQGISMLDRRMLSVKEIIVRVAKALSANRAPGPPFRNPIKAANHAKTMQAVNSIKPGVPSCKVASNQDECAFCG